MQLPWRSLPPPPFARPVRPVVRPLATPVLLGLLMAGATAQWLARCDAADGTDPLFNVGALSNPGLQVGGWWQPVTHLFVQAGPLWLVSASFLALLLSGRLLERIAGRRHLVQIFLLSGALGGLGQVGFNAVLGRTAPVAGASAAAMGVLLALACAAPNAPLLPGRFGVALRRVKATHGALAAILATLLAGEASPAAGMAVGGLVGCLYAQALGLQGRRRFREPAEVEENGPSPVSTASSASWPPGTQVPAPREEVAPLPDAANEAPAVLTTPATAAHSRTVSPRLTERERRMTAREFIAEKVDPILEKISREGLESLSPGEQQLLAEAREKMAREG